MAHRLCALTPALRWLVVRALGGKRDRKRHKNAGLERFEELRLANGPPCKCHKWGNCDGAPRYRELYYNDAAVGKVLIEGLLKMFKYYVSGFTALASMDMAHHYFSVITHFTLVLINKLIKMLHCFPHNIKAFFGISEFII